MVQEQDKAKAVSEQLVHAYDLMMQRTEQILSAAASRSEVVLSHALDTARQKAIELGELTKEEADKIHDFVSHDLYAVGRHLAIEEREVADWLRINLLLVEKDLLERFTLLAQKAKIELKHLEKAKHRYDEWHTGEITAIGTLRCRSCGELVNFERTGHIPPCPKCHEAIYERVKE